jgi:rfaE bifunctional protein kinase chain/domain
LVSFTEKRLKHLLEDFRGKRIAVVGDLMLDRYFWGSVARISPEAPVPVVEVESESMRLGGAANVANNVKSLGADPVLIGVMGNDNTGNLLRDLIVENAFTPIGLIVADDRPTTVKTRVIAHGQHVVRFDRETKNEISTTLQRKILDIVEENIRSLDAIIIEDYNKGVVAKSLIEQLVDLGEKHKKIITADPKFDNFFEYRGTTVFKPNSKELEAAMGVKLVDDNAVEEVGKRLMKRVKAKNVLLTRGEKGMTLFEERGATTHIPAKTRKVADVSGAGDTVISTITVALASGATVMEATSLANYAGGVVCGEVGIVPITRDALLSAVLTDSL